MFTLQELGVQVRAYSDGSLSIVEFQDWFESVCFDAYDDAELRPICAAIDTALSEHHFDDVGEDDLKKTLEAAIHLTRFRENSLVVGGLAGTTPRHGDSYSLWATSNAA